MGAPQPMVAEPLDVPPPPRSALAPLRNPAYRRVWLASVVSNLGTWMHEFTVESWAEHLRQHERMTVADRELVAVTRGFHVAGEPPVVTHYIAAPPRDE